MTAWRDVTPEQALRQLGRATDGRRSPARPRSHPAAAGASPANAPDITEADFQAKVIEYALLRGWNVWHDNDSSRNVAGLPDLICWHPAGSGHFFAELKSRIGRLRPEQAATIAGMRAAGMEVHLWRPGDWPEIVARLDHPDTRTPMEPIR